MKNLQRIDTGQRTEIVTAALDGPLSVIKTRGQSMTEMIRLVSRSPILTDSNNRSYTPGTPGISRNLAHLLWPAYLVSYTRNVRSR